MQILKIVLEELGQQLQATPGGFSKSLLDLRKSPLKKLRGGFLFVIGYLLSPLCWWNDLIFNLPVAYGFGYLSGLVVEDWFLPGTIVGYWLSNVVGILMMQFGVGDVVPQPQERSLAKTVGVGMATSTAYTLGVLVLLQFKVIDLSAIIPSKLLHLAR